MRFNELYNQKILEFISENRCDLSNLSLQKINSNNRKRRSGENGNLK